MLARPRQRVRYLHDIVRSAGPSSSLRVPVAPPYARTGRDSFELETRMVMLPLTSTEIQARHTSSRSLGEGSQAPLRPPPRRHTRKKAAPTASGGGTLSSPLELQTKRDPPMKRKKKAPSTTIENSIVHVQRAQGISVFGINIASPSGKKRATTYTATSDSKKNKSTSTAIGFQPSAASFRLGVDSGVLEPIPLAIAYLSGQQAQEQGNGEINMQTQKRNFKKVAKKKKGGAEEENKNVQQKASQIISDTPALGARCKSISHSCPAMGTRSKRKLRVA